MKCIWDALIILFYSHSIVIIRFIIELHAEGIRSLLKVGDDSIAADKACGLKDFRSLCRLDLA